MAIVNGKSVEYDNKCDAGDRAMDSDWQARVKGILKAELKRRNVSYNDLVQKLAVLGISETEPNIRTKISRGGFTAVFFVQCLVAIGAHTVRLHEAD
jgi:hypothetical protein